MKRKKCIGLGLCCGAVLFLTGCGNDAKTMLCTITDEDSGIYQEYTLNFGANDLFESGHIVQDISVPESYRDYMDTYVDAVKEQFDTSDYKDMDITVTDNGEDTIRVEMNFNADQLSETMNVEMDDSATYDNVKEEMENAGYTCK